MKDAYLTSLKKQFEYYKILAEKTFAQVPDDRLFWQYNDDSNSMAVIVRHLSGNMLSRWTDFLITDGEKEWRNRDAEFENDVTSREELMRTWNEGWTCLFHGVTALSVEDLDKVVYIRNQGHTVIEAIDRQLAHCAYHVGQIVFIGKMISGNKWTSLTIPKGASKAFNNEKFSQEQHTEHFTDKIVRRNNS